MKIRRKVLLLLALVAAGAILTPLLLRLDRVQNYLVGQLQSTLDQTILLQDIRWQWWPTPFATVQDVQIENDHLQLTAPIAEFHPYWLSLLGLREQVGKLVLKKPTCLFKDTSPQPAGKAKRFPPVVVEIEDGSLTLPTKNLLPEAEVAQVNLHGLDAEVKISARTIAVIAHGTTGFSEKIRVQGGYDLLEGTYGFQLAVDALKLHKTIPSIADGKIIPVESVVDLKGDIKGSGISDFQIDLIGDLPCFVVKPRDKRLLITCGFADLSLHKFGRNLSFEINELELKDPRLNLSGHIQKSIQEDQPVWQVDLVARNLDLTGIREKALVLGGDNHVVRVVTGAVRGGHASVLKFSCSGPASTLDRLQAFTISGELKDGLIHVPEVNLDLSAVNGPFAIAQGILTGSDLKAHLGQSTGYNGSILLDLTKDSDAFELALDLDADLSALPEVLHKTVPDPDFLLEVDKFTEIKGRAQGHLRVGDHLHKVKVEVEVNKADASARYERLPWPFRITKGRLHIESDGLVNWRGIRADLGPHHIKKAGGKVTWGNELMVDLTSFQGRLAAEPLFQELMKYAPIQTKLSKVSSVRGPVEINRASLQGPLRRPGEWRYEVEAQAEGVMWDSPLLGQTVTTRRAAFSLNNRELRLRESEFSILDQPLKAKGRFKHKLFDDWHGWLELNGVFDTRLSEWVKQKDWIPKPFFPRNPLIMDNFRISWETGRLSLNGGLVAGRKQQALPRVDLSVNFLEEALQIERLEVRTDNEHGLLVLDTGKTSGCQLDWRGKLKSGTVDAFLEKNDLLTGDLSGFFTCRYAPEKPLENRFIGSLQMDHFSLPWGSEQELLTVEHLQVHGAGSRAEIPRVTLSFASETATGQGELMAGPEGLELDFQFRSPALSWQNLDRLRSAMTESAGGNVMKSLPSWDLLGRLGFEIDEFNYSKQAKRSDEAVSYAWQGVHGAVTLQPQQHWKVAVGESELCGLHMTGSWSSSDRESAVQFFSNPQSRPSFETVFPCLGIDQDLIIGKFDLQASLRGTPGNWHEGEARLHSEQGNIRRLTLLSNIFSVVNLTDLFKNHDLPNPVKGGLPYSAMDMEARVAGNQLLLEKAVVRGEGLNLFGRGDIDLQTFDSDMTILISPFKTIDAIVSRVPLIGRVIGGQNATLVTIPVGVEGPLRDPRVTVLSPEAVGESFLGFVKDTLTLPFHLLSPRDD